MHVDAFGVTAERAGVQPQAEGDGQAGQEQEALGQAGNLSRDRGEMDGGKVLGEVQLQIAGIMSEAPLIEVNEALENAKEQAFKLGVSRGVDPFMTLSFMALTVIPTLRLTTRGVFDVINQRYV